MHRFVRVLSISATVLSVATASSTAAPLNHMNEVGTAILACWTAPADSNGSFVTLSFSFRRDGTLIGPPRPTEINVAGDTQARQQFVDTAVAAFENCLPLEFSPALAEGVAGRVFTLTFTSSNKGAISPQN